MAVVTQVDLARKLGMKVSSVNRILNRRSGRFNKKTIRKVFRAAEALGLSSERRTFVHRRRYERRRVALKAEIELHAADGSVIDRGTCVVDDIAVCGASLIGVELSKGCLPLRPLTIRLEIAPARGRSIEVNGIIVRMTEEGDRMKLGVAFAELRPGLDRRLRKLV